MTTESATLESNAGSNPDTKANPQAMNGAGDWRTALPPDIRAHGSLANFRGVEELAKSWVNVQKLIGAEKLPLPGKEARPEEWDHVWNRLGRPESPERYDLARPAAGAELPWSEDLEKQYRTLAHKTGLTQTQARALLDWYGGVASESLRAMREDGASAKAGLDAELRGEWGRDYAGNVETARRAARQFVGGDTALLDRVNAALGDAAMVRLFHRIGAAMAEDSLRGDGQASLFGSPDAAKAEIAAVLGNAKHAYWDGSHPEHRLAVARMERLNHIAYPTEETG